ncbi:MAG: hypothetical protein ACLFTT_17225 [Candidatus Hydrogenedentota bacterium]
MTYKGHVENGKIVLDEPAHLAEGARVQVRLLDETEGAGLHPVVKRLTGILPSEIDVKSEYIEGMIRKHR